MSMINIKFGNRIKELRREANLTQQELAEMADIDYKYLQKLEGKNPSSPTLGIIEKIAQAFDIPPHQLIIF